MTAAGRRSVTRRGVLRAGSTLVVLGTSLLAMAIPAAAHVTVEPTTAGQGGDVVFTFSVPDEDDHASTTRVVLALPLDTPIASVTVRPTPGWSARLQQARLARPVQSDEGPVTRAVSRVVWSADDVASRVSPGQFQEFVIAAGPLPRTGRLVFKVLQYYSDGRVVRWIDPPASGPEPPHPAPVVTLAADGDDRAVRRDPVSTSPDSGATRLAIVGLAGAGLALLVSGAALLAAVRRADADGQPETLL